MHLLAHTKRKPCSRQTWRCQPGDTGLYLLRSGMLTMDCLSEPRELHLNLVGGKCLSSFMEGHFLFLPTHPCFNAWKEEDLD